MGSLDAVRARKPTRLPTVLSKEEVRRLLAAMPEKGAHRLIVELLYGTGMRVSEWCRWRVCDLDFERSQIVIRGAMGNKDRLTMLPLCLEERLKAQVEFVRLRHPDDAPPAGIHGAVGTIRGGRIPSQTLQRVRLSSKTAPNRRIKHNAVQLLATTDGSQRP